MSDELSNYLFGVESGELPPPAGYGLTSQLTRPVKDVIAEVGETYTTTDDPLEAAEGFIMHIAYEKNHIPPQYRIQPYLEDFLVRGFGLSRKVATVYAAAAYMRLDKTIGNIIRRN